MKTKISKENKQEKLCGRKGEVRLYNMILPPFMLMMFSPLLWLISLAGNFIIDSVMVLIISLIMFRKISGEFYKKYILKVWSLGFASDYIGLIYLLIVGLIDSVFCVGMDYDGNNIFFKYLSGSAMAFHSDTTSFWAVIYLASGILVAAICIFLFNYFISFRKTDLTKKQRLFSSIMLAVCTAPYTLLLPAELFY